MIYFRLKISPVARQNKIITKAVVFSLSLFMTAWNTHQMRNLQFELTDVPFAYKEGYYSEGRKRQCWHCWALSAKKIWLRGSRSLLKLTNDYSNECSQCNVCVHCLLTRSRDLASGNGTLQPLTGHKLDPVFISIRMPPTTAPWPRSTR